MKQQREILRKEKETAEKIAARAFAQSYLSDLVPSVFGTLSDNGYFFDPVERGKHILRKVIFIEFRIMNFLLEINYVVSDLLIKSIFLSVIRELIKGRHTLKYKDISHRWVERPIMSNTNASINPIRVHKFKSN